MSRLRSAVLLLCVAVGFAVFLLADTREDAPREPDDAPPPQAEAHGPVNAPVKSSVPPKPKPLVFHTRISKTTGMKFVRLKAGTFLMGSEGMMSRPGSPEEIFESRQMGDASLFEMLPGMIDERRREPKDDLISVLVHSDLEDDDGTTRKLTDGEIFSFVTLLSIAGTETVARLLSWSAVLLARNPDQRKILVDDPTVIPNGIEEMLRYEAPSPVNARWVTRELEYYGQVVPKDSKMILLNGSADRDERHFENPDVFDVHRKIDRHVAFGYGTHFCVGAALARLESRIAIEETLKRFPTWDIDDTELEWVHTSTVRGFAKVPIHF